MQKIITAAAGLVLGASIGAPASAQNREHQQMAAELRIVLEQNQQLRALVDRQAHMIDELMAAIDANQQFQSRRFADMELLVGTLQTDVGVVRERVQDTESRLRRMSDDMGALQATFQALPAKIQEVFDARVPPPEGAVAAAPDAGLAPQPGADVSLATPPPARPPTVELPATAGLNPSMLYTTAHSDFSLARYDVAIQGFRDLLQYFPDADLADDAQFKIGESYFLLNQFGEAIAAYDAVLQRYPERDQANLAAYKRGNALERLGNAEAARTAYQDVVTRYPDSTGAEMAKSRIQYLDTQSGQR